MRIEPTATDAVVISLAGELDLSTIPTVERGLSEQTGPAHPVIIDLTLLSFIDSSGIALLIKAFKASGGELHTVVAEGSQVERVFRLAGVDRALSLHLDLEAALAAAA